MEGLKVQFDKGAALIVEEKVDGFDTTVQNSLINIGTRKGTDSVFASKGTDILIRALRGTIADGNEANSESVKASLDTLFFVRLYDPADQPDVKLGRVALEPVDYEGTFLKLNASFQSLDEQTKVGTTTLF